MKTLAELSTEFKEALTDEELEAFVLLEPYAADLKAFFQLETGEFDCIGFVGPDGKVTKFADVEKYIALVVLENKARKELANQPYENQQLSFSRTYLKL